MRPLPRAALFVAVPTVAAAAAVPAVLLAGRAPGRPPAPPAASPTVADPIAFLFTPPTSTTTTTTTPTGTPPNATASGCAQAIAYDHAHAAPGFAVECPADAYGHEAATCVNTPPVCPAGSKVILIADPCPAAYMNEAANSWILTGEAQGSLDPYGACS